MSKLKLPTIEEISEFRVHEQLSLSTASRILTQRAVLAHTKQATSIEELKEVIGWMLEWRLR